MERRVLIAIFLSFLVLYSYQAFFVKRTPQADAATGTPAPAADSPASPAAASTAAPAVPDTPTSGATSLVGETVERDVRVETPNVVAVFTNRGARLKSWRLKHYRDNQGESLELVANDVAGQPLPFSLTAPRRRDDREPERRLVCRERRARRGRRPLSADSDRL